MAWNIRRENTMGLGFLEKVHEIRFAKGHFRPLFLAFALADSC
jgi:hypothetical protein